MSQSQLDLNRLIDELKDATCNRKAVTVTYRGGVYKLCPHVLGKKDGRWQCLFYHPGGGHAPDPGAPGLPESWWCIPLEDITDLEVGGGRWRTAQDRSRPEGWIDQVHARAPA